ncbi:nucleoside hydrolase [Corynebacterium camporealensis]
MRMLLDLDTGIDDALALAFALAHPDIELVAVTGTYGNVTVEQGVANTTALLKLLGAEDIPVYAGPQREDFHVKDISQFVHGANGLGGVEVSLGAPPAQGDAVEIMKQAARDGAIIVATGPSTTVAKACEDDDFARNAKIIMMGGALTVAGNVAPWAEANVSQDPAATDFLLRTAQDVTVVGLDVTLRTVLTREQVQQWRDTGSESGKTFAEIADYYVDAYAELSPQLGGCGLHDPLAVAVAIDPSLVECLPINLKVETGEPTPGRLIGDPDRIQEPAETPRVAIGVDAQRFTADFVARLEGLFGELGQRTL